MGVHRSTYYRLKRRVDRWGLEALNVRKRRRPRMPNEIGPHLEQRIMAFALGHPGLGPGASPPSWAGTSGAASASQSTASGACSDVSGSTGGWGRPTVSKCFRPAPPSTTVKNSASTEPLAASSNAHGVAPTYGARRLPAGPERPCDRAERPRNASSLAAVSRSASDGDSDRPEGAVPFVACCSTGGRCRPARRSNPTSASSVLARPVSRSLWSGLQPAFASPSLRAAAGSWRGRFRGSPTARAWATRIFG
jgi:hypothetical protein